jgi:flagellar motor switch protein FliN
MPDDDTPQGNEQHSGEPQGQDAQQQDSNESSEQSDPQPDPQPEGEASAEETPAEEGVDDASEVAQSALDAASAAVASLGDDEQQSDAGGLPEDAASFLPPELQGAATGEPLPEGIDLLSDVNLNVKIELGRTRMLVEDVLRLSSGSVVELDKLAGDPVDVYVNDRHVARGEVLVLNDNFCVRINEILAPTKRQTEGDTAAA